MAVEGCLYCCSKLCSNEGAGFVVQKLGFEGAKELFLKGDEYVVVISWLVALWAFDWDIFAFMENGEGW